MAGESWGISIVNPGSKFSTPIVSLLIGGTKDGSYCLSATMFQSKSLKIAIFLRSSSFALLVGRLCKSPVMSSTTSSEVPSGNHTWLDVIWRKTSCWSCVAQDSQRPPVHREAVPKPQHHLWGEVRNAPGNLLKLLV